jgi:hypothetical protein
MELLSIIDQKTRIVEEFSILNNLPSLSFDASTSLDLPLPPHVTEEKEAALKAMDKLQALLLGPMPKFFHELIHIISLTFLQQPFVQTCPNRFLPH